MTEQDLDYVEQMYAASDDPWRIETGFYEARRLEILLACLPQSRFRRGFEPACASGRLTERLASRCDELLAADVSAQAVALTRTRVPNASVQQLQLPQDWPSGRFDLVVLSEFGYYLPRSEWLTVLERTRASLAPDWTVLACHWKHPFPKRLTETEWLHEQVAVELPGRLVLRLDDEDFRLDIFSSAPTTVAQRDDR